MAFYSLYFSPTGGTKKVADILTRGWEDVARLDLRTEEHSGAAFQSGDVCFVSIPVFEGRVPTPAAARLKTMEGNGAYAILVAVYGARAVDDALLELGDILTERGFRYAAGIAAVAEHSIIRSYGAGRPDAADEADLRTFSERLHGLWAEGRLPDHVSLPGNRPYVEMGGVPFHPSGNKKCVNCGVCAKVCPMGAIAGPDFSKTDKSKCISCMACVSACPTGARDLPRPLVAAAKLAMAKAFKGEHHNELFLEG